MVAEMAWILRRLGTQPKQIYQVKTNALLFEAPKRKKTHAIEVLSTIAATLAMYNTYHKPVLAVQAGADLDSAFVKVCELVWCTAALASSARYLAALYDICQLPAGLVMKQTQAVTIGSVRIYGDLEFVASTESLIKVHMELHHSTYIDSTDFREQMLYRVTRNQDSDACIVLHFLPVELIHDVRILVFSTLAGEMGLITGPQPMFQLHFHTAFVEGASSGRPFVFYKEDLDLLQSRCPVSRVEFVPGARNDDALAAPGVGAHERARDALALVERGEHFFFAQTAGARGEQGAGEAHIHFFIQAEAEPK